MEVSYKDSWEMRIPAEGVTILRNRAGLMGLKNSEQRGVYQKVSSQKMKAKGKGKRRPCSILCSTGKGLNTFILIEK